MESTLERFRETGSGDAFALQNPRLLRVSLSQVTVQAKAGAMVAYQGSVRFEHAGAGGARRLLKKAVTGEGTRLMRVSGSGEVFLASQAQEVHLVRLEREGLTCNGANLLAFEDGIDWDIRRVEGGFAGALAGGLFNVSLAGSGWVALVSDGPPVLLSTGEAPTFADPAAAIAWSDGVETQVRTDVSLKSFLGRASGESLQLAFSGSGWVLVQPSEGRPQVVAAGGGGSGGLLSSLSD